MFQRKLFRFVPRSTLRRALGAMHRGDPESAAPLFEEILSSSVHPPADIVACACEAWFECAARREAEADLAGAVQALERAAALRPGYADVQLRLGRLYERQDQTQRAHEAYGRALEINPRFFEARLNLARLLMHLENGAAALQQLQEAARSGPASAAGDLQELLSSVPSSGSLPSTTRARLEALFDKLLAGAPSTISAGLEQVRGALRRGDNTLAIGELKQLLKRHPEFPDLHNLLGVAYDNEEMTDDAIEEFEQALHLNSGYLDARLNLGLALFERGRDREAEAHLRRVVAAQPHHELAQSVLAQITARSAVR